MYKVVLKLKKPIPEGHCANCDFHGIHSGEYIKEFPGSSATFCGMTGEDVPERLDTEKYKNPKCPVVKVKKGGKRSCGGMNRTRL